MGAVVQWGGNTFERRSHKINFERYLFIIAIKIAIFHYYHVTAFRTHQIIINVFLVECYYSIISCSHCRIIVCASILIVYKLYNYVLK